MKHLWKFTTVLAGGLFVLSLSSAGYDDPNKSYRLYSRCWQRYAADEPTEGLFHLDQSADDALDDLEGDLDDDKGLGAGLGGVGKTAPDLAEGKRTELADASTHPSPAFVIGSFTRGPTAGRFGDGIRLQGKDSAIVTPTYQRLRRRGQFGVEAWFRPAARKGVLFHLPGRPALAVSILADGALQATFGKLVVKTDAGVIVAKRWQHVGVTVVPGSTSLRSLYGTSDFGKDGLGPRAIGRFQREAPEHSPQLRLVVNGRILKAHSDRDLLSRMKQLSGGVWIGNNHQRTAGFAGDVDEIRVSSQGRLYYEHTLERFAASAGKDFPSGPPAVRRAGDQVLHVDMTAAAKKSRLAVGVHGAAAIVGPGRPNPVTAVPKQLSARSGTLEFWFSPHDWDNGKLRYRKEQIHEQPPLEMAPVVGVGSRGKGGKDHWLLTIAAHVMWPEIGEPQLILQPGRWYHVVVTFDHGIARTYLNGERYKGKELVVRALPPPAAHQVSRILFGHGFPWKQGRVVDRKRSSLVDEVRFYARPLTPPEVRNTYARYVPELAVKALPYAHHAAAMDPLRRLVFVDTTVLQQEEIRKVGVKLGAGAEQTLPRIHDNRAWGLLDGSAVDGTKTELTFFYRDAQGALKQQATLSLDVPPPPFADDVESPPYRMAFYPYPQMLRFVFQPLWQRGVIRSDFLRTADGRPGLHGEYFDNAECDGTPILTRVDPSVSFAWRDSPLHNVPQDYFGVVWQGVLGPIPYAGKYEIAVANDHGVRLLLDDEAIIDTWGKKGSNTAVVNFAKGETRTLRLQYREFRGDAGCRLQWRLLQRPDVDTLRPVRVRVTDAAGRGVVQRETRIDRHGEGTVTVGALADGKYKVFVRLPAGEKEYVRWFARKKFEWEHNKLGITREVLPPFKAIRVDGRTVEVVMRKYRQGSLGLWDAVQAKGNETDYRELLAGPIQLLLNGEPLQGGGAFTSTAGHEVVYAGAAKHAAGNISTRCTTEYDGCMKVELTLAPAGPAAIQSLVLDVPIKDDMAPLWHVLKTNIRSNPAGKIPRGAGEVWNSKKLRDGNWPGNFKHYFWFGAEERGLSWFADNEKGWVMDWKKQPPCQTLVRKDGVLHFRVHLVQKPIILKEPRTIVFGLMASPAKPMPKDWRAIGRPERRGIDFTMGHYFGLPGTFAAKYPMNKDFSSFDKFYELRQGKKVDASAFAENWVERNCSHEGATRELRDAFRNLVKIAVSRGRSKDHFTAYFDEFRATTTFCEEHPYYRNSWDVHNTMLKEIQNFHERFGTKVTEPGHWKWYFGSGATVPSYVDFCCWFGAKWLKRSVGLYFDNAFVKTPANNPYLTTAFFREDGKIQPSTCFWAKRDYLKRIWVLHQQLRLPQTPQIMMIHMTNAHIIPWESFNEVNLDLEWKFGARPFQAKFSPELLRVESTGLQTGCIPMAISDTENKGVKASETNRKLAERTRWAGFAVHEIRMEWSGQKWPKSLSTFGYGRDDCTVYNYWQPQPPITVSDDACKWLLLKRKGKLLLLLCSWNRKDNRVVIEFDFDKLGVRPKGAIDVEHPKADAVDDAMEAALAEDDDDGMDLGFEDNAKIAKKMRDPNGWQGPMKFNAQTGKLSVPLFPYGVRLIRLE